MPEPLFRRLSTAIAGPSSLRVLATEIIAPAGTADGPWILELDLDADVGGLLVVDQTGSQVTWGRVVDPPRGLEASIGGQGRVARVVSTVSGRHRLRLELVPEPTRAGDVEETIVNLPPAPRATLRIDEPVIMTGRRTAWQCDRSSPDGGWLPAASGGVFDVAGAARIRVVRPVDRRAALAAGLAAAVSFNDIAWRGDECRVTASFDVGAEGTIVRQLVVRADPRLEPVAAPRGSPSLQPLGGGRHLVEIPEPRVGQRRVVVEFRLPLADPVGVFDAPFAWLQDVEADVRTARLRPEPGLAATAELPPGMAPVRPRLEDGPGTTAVWRSDAVTTEGASTTELRPRITVTRQLSESGADIATLNAARRQLSLVKGGGLAKACTAGNLLVLVLSDVIGDDLDVIASGPCMPPEPSTPPGTWTTPGGCHVRHVIVGDNGTTAAAAAAAARQRRYTVVQSVADDGQQEASAEAVGARLATDAVAILAAARRDGRPRALIVGGEATVTVPADHGMGGRNQQTVLAAIDAVNQTRVPWPAGLLIASVGTDGEDGPTDAAGGCADAAVVAEIERRDLDVPKAIARCDAYPLLAAAGGLIRTGPTGTNVADIRIVLARP